MGMDVYWTLVNRPQAKKSEGSDARVSLCQANKERMMSGHLSSGMNLKEES